MQKSMHKDNALCCQQSQIFKTEKNGKTKFDPTADKTFTLRSEQKEFIDLSRCKYNLENNRQKVK